MKNKEERKQQIINQYRIGKNPSLDWHKYNAGFGYANFKMKEGSRYYLYPSYVDVTDLFTAEELVNTVYIGDLMQVDYTGENAKYAPKHYFGDNWTPETGYID